MIVKYLTDKGTWVIRGGVRKVEWLWGKAEDSPWGTLALHEKINIEGGSAIRTHKTVLILLQHGDVESEQLHLLETNGVVYILNENGKTVESF